jgi:hypothetical protein
MNKLEQFAINQIRKTKGVYLLSPERMFSEYNGEKENVKNYNGRQLLEMLQNADDAASEATDEKKALIQLVGDTLYIANTGYPFSEQGLNSIFHSHLSPKQAEEKQIGKKGLGFRSILSWSREVTIKSKGLCVSFSEGNSREILDELLADEEFSLEYKKLNILNSETPISTLVCPKIVNNPSFEKFHEYDTTIAISLRSDALQEVKKQLKGDIDGEVLLFLKNLHEIKIEVEGQIKSYSKKILSNNKLEITKVKNGRIKTKLWNVHLLAGKFAEIGKPYELGFAWTDDLSKSKDVLYSYFRTKVNIKCNGVLHGSFELNADRNLLISDNVLYNEKLLSLLPLLLSEVAEMATRVNEPSNYIPLQLVELDISGLKGFIENKKFDSELAIQIKKRNVFPNIAGVYISWPEGNIPVYYDEKILSEHLTPTTFPLILQWCEDKFVNDLLKMLLPRRYKVSSIIKDIIRQRQSLSKFEYANLIVAIHDLMNEKNKDDYETVSLLYDSNFNELSFQQQIFLPENDKLFDFPSDVGIQIVDPELASNLLEATGSANYGALSKELKMLGLKEYTFNELMEKLIFHYEQSKNATDVHLLHQNLFNIYKSYDQPGNRWHGSSCKVLNKKGNLTDVKKIYFGKEYSNSFIDDIYHYDKRKIIASPQKFKPTEASFEKWQKYLEWLGVEYVPRHILESGGRDYAEHVMRNYNYKIPIDKSIYKNFKDFQDYLVAYKTATVTTIDDLDNILDKNSSENIFRLINADDKLQQILEKDKEPIGGSLDLNISKMWYLKTIDATAMKSYLKWRITNKKWLATESLTKAAPSTMATAGYINEDFRGFVEKPLLDYDILKRYNIERLKIDHLLWLIGVHKSIDTFSTSLLYSILLNLPSIDDSGKKAKTIYNQLAANFEDKNLDKLDKSDVTYLQFKANGEVFCKDGLYHAANKAYYVNDKRYGETITRQFLTIDIDRRRGRDKIKNLFGVAPLENITLDVIGVPDPHELNATFVTELENFKPYVYTLRKEVDGGNEKNVIKDTKFNLCSNLSLKLKKDEKDQIIELNNYEYFYDKKKKTVYLVLSYDYSSVNDLKDDIHVCSAIADAFSAILDVDAQRQQIRELFSKGGVARDELLRSELDDDSLKKLSEARQLLNIVSNPKFDFWKSIIKCFPTKKLKLIDDSDDQLYNSLIKLFPKFNDSISAIFSKINYDDINEEESALLILELLSSLNKTVANFNSFHYPPFDISEVYQTAFNKLKQENRDFVIGKYYEKCSIQPLLQAMFLSKISNYDLLLPTVVNEIDFQIAVTANFWSIIDKEYGLLEKDSKDFNTINLEDVKQLNITAILATHSEANKSALFSQFLNEKPAVESKTYFSSQLESISIEFTSWLGQSGDSTNSPLGGSKRFNLGKEVLLYDDLLDLKGQMDVLLGEKGLNKVTATGIKTLAVDIKNKTKPGGNNTTNNRKPKIPKEEIGFLGEYIVYHYLLRTTEKKESVRWMSEYARLCGVNALGRDGLGYDIEFIPNNSTKKRFIEVKSVGNEDAFHITNKEIKWGELNRKDYDIYLVRGSDDPASAKIERISRPFDYKGKTFTSNSLFSVVNDNYIIKFQKQ